MENGLSTSLDENELKKVLGIGSEQTSGSFVTEEFAQQIIGDERAKIAAATRAAQQFDPETYAKARQLAPGLDPAMAVRNLKDITQIDRLNKYREVLDASPVLKSYFTQNPTELAHTNPDELDKYSGIEWALRAVKPSLEQGIYLNQLNSNAAAIVAGTATPDQVEFVKAAQNAKLRNFGSEGWLSEGLTGLMQTLPYMLDVTASGAEGGIKGAVAGGLAGGAVGALTGPGAAATAATGFGYGGTVGASSASLMRNIELSSGAAYVEFQTFRDANGQPLDEDTLRWASFFTGVGVGGLEQLGLTKTLGQVPGVGKIFDMFGKEGMSKVLKNPKMLTAFTEFAKRMGSSAAYETFTEMGQEAIQILGGELAKSSEGDFAATDPALAGDRILEAGKQALQVQTLLAPIFSGTRFAADIQVVERSRRENAKLKNIASQLINDPLIQRSPDVATKIIDSATQGQKLYIPADQLVQLYQSQGLDVYGPELPNWRTRLTEAVQTGGDVQLSMGEFLVAFGKQANDSPLMDLVRTDPTNYTSKDIAEYSAAMDDLLKSELAKAQDKNSVRMELDKATIQTFQKQATDAGFTEKAATHYATMLSAFVQTKARQLGVTPQQFMNENMVNITRADMPANDMTINAGNEAYVSGTDLFQQTVDEMLAPAQEQSSTLDAFEEAQVQTDLGAIPEAEFNAVYQTTPNAEPRGAIEFNKDGSATIKLFGKSDMSTLLHEAGHFFLQTTRDLASKSPEIQKDWEVLVKQLGIAEDGKITRDQHEAFAKMTEAYFMEGKAPTPALRAAFEAFRLWLKAIYRSVKALGQPVSPEISQVLDRMLGAEAMVENIANDTAYRAMFADANAMGVTPEEYLAYQNLVEDARRKAQDSALGRIVGQQKKLATGWFKEIEREYTKLAEAELLKETPYRHLKLFKEKKIQINTEEMAKKYGKETMAKFPREAFSLGGMDPQIVAEMLGYPTADEMVYDFRQAPALKDAAKERAKAKMVETYGADFTKDAIIELAVKRAMAEDGRVTILAKEYAALRRKAGNPGDEVSPRQFAARIARETIYRKRIMDLNEAQIQAAARRAASAAERATLAGDWAVAADWKRKQMIAQAMDNENQRVVLTVEKIRNKAARYTKTASKAIDPATMEQIRALVMQYGFAKMSNKKLGKIMALRDYMDKAEAEGLVTKIPDYLLKKAAVTSFRELTVEELLGFGDALDNLEHLGRLKNRLLTAKKAHEFGLVKAEIINKITERPTTKKVMKNYAEVEKGWSDHLSEFTASWLKPEQIIEWLDGGAIDGPMAEYVFQPIADAQNTQNELTLKYNEKLMNIFDKVDSSYLTEQIYIPSIKKTFSREQLYAVALNTGNDSNRAKLLEGEMWGENDLEAILAPLKKEDWDRIQAVWNTLDSLWEKIAALEKRLTGVAPPKIEARQINNLHGTYAGGYYPAIYDFETDRGINNLVDPTPVDKRLDADSLFNPAFIKPGTNHVHTYKRTKVAKPIKLELSVLPGHLHNVIHDLSYREAVRGAYRILWDPEVKRAITGVESEAVYTQLQHWLKSVATEHSVEQDPNVKLIQRFRTGATMFGMGYRVSTALAQPLGLFPAMTRVKPARLLNALSFMTRHPINTTNMINELSGELKARFNSQDRDIKDTVKKISMTSSRLDKVRSYAFYFIGAMDKYVSSVVWLAAYQQAQENGIARDLAIREADRTVRLTQGTGTVKDMAKITNDGEVLKLFTMFYSYFSAQWNMQVDLTRKTKADISQGDYDTLFRERIPQWIYLVVAPAVLGELLLGHGPADGENPIWWATKKSAMYPLLAMPFVRDIVGSVGSGYGYQFSPAAKGGKATADALSQVADLDFLDAIKPAATALSIALKIPAGQAITSVEALFQGLINGDFKPTDLVYGRGDR